MSALILFLVLIASFVFYGIVGENKAWLLGPAFLVTYVTIGTELVKRAVRKPSERIGRPVTVWGWLLFAGWGVAMTFLAPVPYESRWVLLFLVAVLGAYVVWSEELIAFKDNRLLLGALIFAVTMAALYGMVVHFKCPERVLWGERYAIYEGRLMSTYICPNHFAHLMQMLLPFCLALLFIPQSGFFLKALSAYGFVAFLPPLVLTESRAGWLGSLTGVGIMLCLMAWRKSKKWFAALVVIAPLCAVLILLAGWRYSEMFQRRAKPVVEFLQGQAQEGVGSESRDFRPQTWMDTIDMIGDAPWFGHGPGNYRYTFPKYRERFRGQRIVTGHPHNEYLELLADYGWVGFLLFAGTWLCGCVWVLLRALKAEEPRHALMGFAFVAAAAGTMVHSFFDFEMRIFPNAMAFAFLAALAVGPLSRRDFKQPRRKAIRRVGPVLMAVLFLGFTAWSARTIPSAYATAVGDRAFEARDFEAAEAAYRFAARCDAENWRALRGCAKLLHDRRRFELNPEEKLKIARRERDAFEASIRANPMDPEGLASLGGCLLFIGRKTSDETLMNEGLDRLREACVHRKYNDEYWWKLGVELRKLGRYPEALEVFERHESIKRTPSSRMNVRWLKARIARVDEPPDEASPKEEAIAEKPPTIEIFETPPPSADDSLNALFEAMRRADD